MDRFIGSSILVFVNVESDLKSNMDRFIGKSLFGISEQEIGFKIQYG